MKNIEIDEELYQYIVGNTQYIGESASSILRRLLTLAENEPSTRPTLKEITTEEPNTVSEPLAHDHVEPAASAIESSPASPEIEPAVSQADDGASVFDYINKEEMALQRGAVGRFLLILAALYRVHGDKFSVVYDIRGRDRLYFSDNEAALEQSGSSTKPRQIPESPFWVITNSNTTRKKMMLTEASKALGYSEADVEKIRDLL